MILAWCLCIGSALIVIANRAHYTADVLVAFYIAGGNFYIWTYVFDHYIEEKGRLRDLTRPWGDGPDPRSHTQERERRRQRKAESDVEKDAMDAQEADAVQMEPIVVETVPTTSSAQPRGGANYSTREEGTSYQQSSTSDHAQGKAVMRDELSPHPEHPQEELLGEANRGPLQLPGEPYNATGTQ